MPDNIYQKQESCGTSQDEDCVVVGIACVAICLRRIFAAFLRDTERFTIAYRIDQL